MALAVLLLPLLGLRLARRALGGRALLLCVALAGAGTLFGCGGGGGSSTPPLQPQNYTLTVTATSGTLSHTTTLTPTVQQADWGRQPVPVRSRDLISVH